MGSSQDFVVCHGEIELFQRQPDGTCRIVCRRPNAQLRSGIDLLIRRLVLPTALGINGMYMEYRNGNPSSITAPTFNISSGIEYFREFLPTQPNAGYIRVPLESAVTSATDSRYTSNQLIVRAASNSQPGMISGRPFGYEHGSVVYGGALVSMHPTDPSKDTLYARSYWADFAERAEAGGALGVTWYSSLFHSDDQ